ncbi:MAG: SDR family NAD(P)-dependent oxidoreductase [Ferruginibacter sp.]
MKKIVFITGASSGIGKACAIKYAMEGNDLIITGRRKERLDELKNELESSYKIKVLVLAFDVQDKNAVFESINHIPAEWQQIDILINNAALL